MGGKGRRTEMTQQPSRRNLLIGVLVVVIEILALLGAGYAGYRLGQAHERERITGGLGD